MENKSMVKEHQYHFELKYNRMVNGVKKEYVVPITAINKRFTDACNRVDEYVKENFGDRVTTDSRIQYVGEFVNGKLIPFVEVKKEDKEMRTKKKSYEVMEMENGFLSRYVEQLKKVIDGWIEMDNAKRIKISELENRMKEKQKKLNVVYNGGFQFMSGSRGSGKQEFERQRSMLNSFMYTDNTLDDIIEKVKNTHPQIFDVNSLYPQAVDVCKVYQIERDQALKENDALMNKVSGYKKELGKLNLLMDDMENRLEKELIVRQGMNNQMKKWKAEMKRKNKIIDALTEDKDEK